MNNDVITVPIGTIEVWKERIEELRREVESHGLELSAVISHPAGQEAKARGLPTGEPIQLMLQRQTKWTPQRADLVMDPDSMLNQGLADALDARELDVVEVRPVLLRVPERVGKGVRQNVLDALSPETWTEKAVIRNCRRCGDEYSTLNRSEESDLCWDCVTGVT